MRIKSEDVAVVGLVTRFATVLVALLAAWATHIAWIVGKLASDASIAAGQAVLAILGVMFPPVGIIHGVMIWFGYGLG